MNISGALLLGLLTGLWMAGAVTAGWHDILGVGFLGGYTTFCSDDGEEVGGVRMRRAQGRQR
ncbi:hypothetical protein [Microbispora sp. CA-102843]|uniref:hypothetical protein n=1 Tax=Microbispora sp. CA-102843 TaxID=3239952 RepID=UPI003D8BCBBF